MKWSKMDRFEDYIRNHKDEFDTANPDPGLWNAIEDRLPEPQRSSRVVVLWKYAAAAAVALLLIMTGVVVGTQVGGQPDTEFAAQYDEFRQAEQYYRIQLDEKINALNQYAPNSNVESDLKELEDLYSELSDELEDGLHPNQNDIIQALILNYQTRIDMLERVLERVKEGQDQSKFASDEDENMEL